MTDQHFLNISNKPIISIQNIRFKTNSWNNTFCTFWVATHIRTPHQSQPLPAAGLDVARDCWGRETTNGHFTLLSKWNEIRSPEFLLISSILLRRLRNSNTRSLSLSRDDVVIEVNDCRCHNNLFICVCCVSGWMYLWCCWSFLCLDCVTLHWQVRLGSYKCICYWRHVVCLEVLNFEEK